MKLLHTADVHLDSPMQSNLSPEQARRRRGELQRTFSDMVEAGARQGVRAVLIAGDLFESSYPTAAALAAFLDLVSRHPQVDFLLLRGNHDRASLSLLSPPENLKFFGQNEYTCYRYGQVAVYGCEKPDIPLPPLDKDSLNIVMLHGQAGRAAGEGLVDLRAFEHRHIDYLALGHVHSYQSGPLPERGVWCYSGCPEGRGYDECGEKGYVLLEVADGRLTHTFVPSGARRRCHTVPIDLTGAPDFAVVEKRVREAVAELPKEDLVKVVLQGTVGLEVLMDTALLAEWLSEHFFAARVEDALRLAVRAEDYRYDLSLRGEFVRTVLASELSEQDREQVILCGTRALNGEEI
ncbi:MAG: metallophosphoesterase [Eubacteriales bacterium]